MLKSIEMQGITRDEAIEKALSELGLDRDSVSVEVLDNGKRGFLGIGATPARVKVSYEAPEETPKKAAAPQKPVPQKPVATKQPSAPQPHKEQVSPQRTAPAVSKPVQSTTPAQEAPAIEYTPGTPLTGEIPVVAQQATGFIDGLLEKMGIAGHAVVLDTTTTETVQIEIVGEDMGHVIGRRGDTLDAIQYLTSLVANRAQNDHTRVIIDTENYRAKREDSLKRLAHKMANKVIKYHKSMTLEPMNPYERRIIHATLQEVKGITTYSTGTEPARRVVIALEGRTGGTGRSGSTQRYHDNG